LSEAAAWSQISGLEKLRVDPRGAELELSGSLPLEPLGPLLAQLLEP
jgi:hypothetical protein